MKRSRCAPGAIVGGCLVLALQTGAQVPQLLNYQGRLTDPSGAPKNGTFTMQFAVYDAETGGNQLPTGSPWSETQSVTVTNGVFNVLLGSVTALPATMFDGGPSDAAGPLRFLQVTVGGEVLSPRRRVVSAAYAMKAPAPSCSWISGSGCAASWCVATCPAETLARAGGCGCGGPPGYISISDPIWPDQWRCVCGANNGITAYALCCTQ